MLSKLFKSMLVLSIILALVGCSSTTPTEETSTVEETETTTETSETTQTVSSDYDPSGMIDYMKDNPTTWMSVDNGYWSEDPADQPTDEELTEMLDTAMMAQLAVQYNEVFCVVLRDYDDQFDIIGDYWDNSGKAIGKSVTEGTVTVLFYADKILDQEEHASTYGEYLLADGSDSGYGSYYQQAASTSYIDTGLTMAYLQFAAHSLGYNTHVFGGLYGEVATNNPTKYIDGKNLMRGWGFPHEYGEDIKDIPLEGNVKLVGAVVIGKRDDEYDAVTSASMHMRPTNYYFYDGVDESGNVSAEPKTSESADAESDTTTGATEEVSE